MDSRRLRGGRGATPQFVKPLLSTLHSMRAQERMRPDQLNAAAEELLLTTFGAEGGVGHTAYAHSALDLMAEHTRFFDGFALLMPLHAGCSVCVRLHDGAPQVTSKLLSTGGEVQGQSEELEDLVRVALTETPGYQAAVVSNTPRFLTDGDRAPTLVATTRALGGLLARSGSAKDQLERMLPDDSPDSFHVMARSLASLVTDVPAFLLADTREREYIAVDVPQAERPGLAVAIIGGEVVEPNRDPRRKLLGDAMGQLSAASFPGITSPRAIEHRDLSRATEQVGRRARPLLNYMVGENGRVQKLVAAIQHRDWQMLGALLLMSHASKVGDMGMADDRCDFVVKAVENMSLDGMYGATRINEGSRAVVLAGQPFSVPPALETLRTTFEERFGDPLTTLLL